MREQFAINAAIAGLNANTMEERISSIVLLKEEIQKGTIQAPQKGTDVNNHIHTTYSFSPYSPAKAVWMSYMAGLSTAGIMDHDSIKGAVEFKEAGCVMNLDTTVGIEMRADMSKTVLNGRRINNPDQSSIAYVALHGVPAQSYDSISSFMIPYSKNRNIRNRIMIDRLNLLLINHDVQIDFDKDVKPLSLCDIGGSITERHLLYALSLKLIHRFGVGPELISFLKESLKLDVSAKLETLLIDSENAFLSYDLLGLLKGSLVQSFYVDAIEECPDIEDVIRLANETGSICAYAYLGDVSDSVTGDKKNQMFEDSYLDELFETISQLGFHAVTYMPSRNSDKQLERIRNLCEKFQLFQISGEDINSPRQKFICDAMKNPEHQGLIDAAWALIGHEKASEKGLESGMFSTVSLLNYPNLTDRVKRFAEIGKSTPK